MPTTTKSFKLDKIQKPLAHTDIIKALSDEGFIHGYIRDAKGEPRGVLLAGYRPTDKTIFISSSRCRVKNEKFDKSRGLTMAVNRYVKNVYGKGATDADGIYPYDYTFGGYDLFAPLTDGSISPSDFRSFKEAIEESIYGGESTSFKKELYRFISRACRYYKTIDFKTLTGNSPSQSQRIVFAMSYVDPNEE